MNFDEICDVLDGKVSQPRGRAKCFCLVPNEFISKKYGPVGCNQIGGKVIKNTNNEWENLNDFGMPDAEQLCQLESISTEYLTANGLVYRDARERWWKLSMQEREDQFLEHSKNLNDVPKGENYIPGNKFFYTETHEGPVHTHINYEGNQTELYNKIRPILEKNNIKFGVSRFRIKIWCSHEQIPEKIKNEIYNEAKKIQSNKGNNRLGKLT